MKKFSNIFIGLTSFLMLGLIAISCEVGLGSTIDIVPPTVKIASPKDSAIIRGAFALYGTWTDDGELRKVEVVLNSTSNSSLTYSFTGEFTGNSTIEEKTWKCLIDPLSQTVPIKDGEYLATVSVTDKAGRVTKVTKTFTIDNTPPVLVLQRPGTNLASTSADSYGQSFTLEGQGADSSNINRIDVHIFDDEDCLNHLKTVTLNNVPLNIKLDVATFTDEAYTAIYGSTEKQGEKQRYCKIDAYDSAQKYPVESGKNQTAEDTVGNKTSIYYLYDEIQAGVLNKYNIAEIYEMMNGTYTIPEKDRQTVTQSAEDIMETVKAALGNKTVKIGTFSLNPENNPKFTLNGKEALLAENLNLANEDLGYYITNGSDINIEVTPGLDGTSVVNTTEKPLKVYVIECDATGNILDSAKRIYPAPASSDYIKKSGSTYKIFINLNVETAFSEDGSQYLKIGHMYRLGVEGEDYNGNEIIASADTGFGFYLASSGRAPELKVTSPTETTVYLKGGDSFTINGYTIASEGLPAVQVFVGDNTTAVWEKTFVDSEGTVVTGSTKKRYDFTAVVPSSAFDQTTENDYSIDIISSIGDKGTTVTKTVWYDLTKPTIDFTSISPVIDSYEFADSADKLAAAANYNSDDSLKLPFINGTVRFRGAVEDSLTKISSVEWRVIQNDVTISGIGGTIGTRFDFVLDTTVTSIIDNKNITVSFIATDLAGNTQTVNKQYFVCQNTDKPLAGPNNQNAWTVLVQQPKAIRDGTYGEHSNRISAGSSIYAKVTDDDGIKSVAFTVEKLGYNENYEESYVLLDQSSVPADVKNGFYNDLGSPVETIVNHPMPTFSGYFKVTITVVDVNDISSAQSFVIQMTGAAPDVTVTNKSDFIKEGEQVQLEVTMQGESPFTIVVLQNDGSEDWKAETSIDVSSNTKTINVTPIANPVTQQIKVRVTDNSSGVTTKTVEYKVDNTAPAAPVIESPAEGSIGSSSLTGSSFVFSGKANDATGTGSNETSSGIKKLYYAFMTSNTLPSTWFEQTASSGTWNINATLQTGTGATSGTNLFEGEYWLYIKSEDGAGNQSTVVKRNFTVDQSAPTITGVMLNGSIALTDGIRKDFKTESGNFTISGNVSDTNGIASLTVMNNSVTPASDGAWTYSITRKENELVNITVAAEDNAGRKTTLTYSIFCDTREPTLSITNPDTDLEGETSLAASKYTFRGSADDDGSGVESFKYIFSQTVYATDNDIIASAEAGTDWTTVTSSSSSYSFATAKDLIEGTTPSTGKLHEGKWYLYAYAMDKVGTSSVAKRLFWVDKKAPTLSLDNIDSVTNDTITISGSVNDANGIQDIAVKITPKPSTQSTDTVVLTEAQFTSGKVYKVGSGVANPANDEEYLTDGSYTIEVTVTDKAGKTTTQTRTVLVDTVAPNGVVSIDESPITLDGKDWFNKETLTVKFVQQIPDTGSEIDTVMAKFIEDEGTDFTGLQEFTKKTSSGNTWWEAKLDIAVQGKNGIHLVVTDKAGNSRIKPAEENSSVYVDTEDPDECDVYAYVSDDTDYSIQPKIEGVMTINGKIAKTFVIKAVDNDNSGSNTYSGIKEVYYKYGTGSSDKIVASVLNAENHTFKLTIPQNVSGTDYQTSGKVYFYIEDKLGNDLKSSAFNFTLDETSPTVQINAVTDAWTKTNGDQTENIDINGELTLSGTSSDSSKVESIELKYAVGSEPADWSSVTTEATVSGTTSWTATIDTTSLTDESKLYIKAYATDEAGNVGESDTKILYINQASDRPIITFSNLDLSQPIIWLKGIKNAYGSIFDDDGNIQKLEYKTGAAGEYKEITVTNGSWNQEIADGQNEIYFRIKDAKDKVFETGTATEPKLKSGSTFKDGVLTIKVDTTSPKYTNLMFASKKTDGTQSAFTNDITSLIFGGKYTKLLAKVNASDENGVKSVTLKLNDGDPVEAVIEGDATVNKNSSGSFTWTFPAIELPGSLTGNATLKLVIEDQAGTSREDNINFTIDNTKPELSFTNYTNGASVFATADVTIRGSAKLNDLEEWSYAVTNTEIPAGDTTYTPLIGGATSFTIVFDGGSSTSSETHAPNLFNHILTLEGIAQGVLQADDTLRNLYIHIKGNDTAGNESDVETLYLKVIPNGDKPSVTFSYPSVAGAALGGTIRVTGSSEIRQSEVAGVYIQIDPNPTLTWEKSTNGTHYLNSSTYTKYTGKRYKLVNSDYTEDAEGEYVKIGEVYSLASDVLYLVTSAEFTDQWDANLTGAGGTSARYPRQTVNYTGGSKPAIKTGGSVASWNITLNSYDELNNSQAVALKIFAVSTTEKKSDEQVIWFRMDPDAPQIGSSTQLQLVQYEGGSSSGTIVARRNYEANMWIKGKWYLIGSVTDDSGIKNIRLKIGSEDPVDLVEIVNNETNTGAITTNPDYATYVVQGTSHDSNYDYQLNIPVGYDEADKFGTLSYEISATEGAAQSLATKQSIALNYDNKEPDFVATDANVLNAATWDGKKATELATAGTIIKNSAGTYSFFGAVNEASDSSGNQSGFNRVAMYFTRVKDGFTYIIDPMRTGGTAGRDNFVATDTECEATTAEGLYWLKARGFTVSENNILTAKDTSTSLHSSVRRGGLVKVNGAIYVIKTVDLTSKKITVEENLQNGDCDVYFAVGQIVDNLTAENGTTAAYDPTKTLPTSTNDDGDQMIESVSPSGTMYTWQASLDSRLILDGDVTMHFVAFDKAGNFKSKDYNAIVKNNAPRLYGVKYGTDVNGNGTIDDDEYITTFENKYSVLSGGTTYYGYEGNTNTPVTEITATSQLTVKESLRVVPRVVGGNLGLGYTYTYKEDPEQAATTTTTFEDYSVGHATDLRDNTLGITIAQKFFIQNIKDGAQDITFKIWDKTDGTTAGSTSNSAKIVIPVNVAVQDNVRPVAQFEPFKWVSASDNSMYANSSKNGHIELEADLPSATFTAGGTGVYDRDAKVSGKITFVGKVTDNVVVKEIKVKIPNYNGGAAFVIATRDNTGSLTSTNTLALGGSSAMTYADYDFASTAWYFEQIKDEYATDGSNTVEFKFHFDTTKITGVAQTDIGIELTASDRGKAWINSEENVEYTPNVSEVGSTSTTTDSKTGYYKVDVVPYISGIETSLRSIGGLKKNNIRSATGKYSVMKVDDANFITVNGFNLDPSAVRIVSESVSPTATASSGIAVSFSNVGSTYASFNANANLTKSGYMEVFVNGVRTLNNINANDSQGSFALTGKVEDYKNMPNREADFYTTKNVMLTDDRYILVFDVRGTGTSTKNGYYPTMIMNGDNPVFAYINKSGGSSGTVTKQGIDSYAGTYYPSHAMPQRTEWDVTSNTKVYTEYLIKASTWDSMAMAKDEGGRYYHVSVYNRDEAAMSFIYDRYAELYNSTAYLSGNAAAGWGSGTGYSGYPASSSNYGVWAHEANNNALTLDSVNYEGLNTDRYQYPKLIAKGNSKTGDASVYMAYYDEVTAYILVRNFQIGTTATGNRLSKVGTDIYDTAYAQYVNFAENSIPNKNYTTGRLTGTKDGSKYFSIAVTSSNNLLLLWYSNADSRLKLAYTTAPVTGATPNSALDTYGWIVSNIEFPTYKGTYVSMALDSNDGIHIAGFDANDSDLTYMYLPSYSSAQQDLKEMTVDATGSVGQWTQIKVKGNVPYISYYNSTETGGRDSIKLAYAKAAAGSVEEGIDSDGYTTGKWEYMTVPAIEPPVGGDPKFQNVCLDFDSSNRPVVGYLSKNLEFGKWLEE